MTISYGPGVLLKKYRLLSSLAELPTMEVPAVKPDETRRNQPLYALPPLPFFLDTFDRICLKIWTPYEATGPLALAMVQRYIQVIETYPQEIVLDAERYWSHGKMAAYLEIPTLYLKIPYVHDESSGDDFDIMVRGVRCRNF